MDNTIKDGINTVLFITFVLVCLKQFNIIDWEWHWVLFPIWYNIIATLIITLYLIIFKTK